MTDNSCNLLLCSLAIYAIAAVTGYSAYHRQGFIKFFVPGDEWKQVLGRGLRKKDAVTFRQDMRVMARIEAAFATVVFAAAISCLIFQ